MNGIKNLMRRPGFYIFLFLLGVLLLNWPLLTAFAHASQKTIFAYFFLVWIMIILILFLARDTGDERPSDNGKDPTGEDTDV
jgi:hypothetical protein